MELSWLPWAKVMEVSADAPSKALCPMLETDAGISIEVSTDALKNAPSPMLVTPSGMVMEVSADAP